MPSTVYFRINQRDKHPKKCYIANKIIQKHQYNIYAASVLIHKECGKQRITNKELQTKKRRKQKI